MTAKQLAFIRARWQGQVVGTCSHLSLELENLMTKAIPRKLCVHCLWGTHGPTVPSYDHRNRLAHSSK